MVESPRKILLLPLAKVHVDPRMQFRAGGTDPLVAAEYAETLRGGGVFPAVIVFWDGKTYWLASGFHRLEAHRLAGRRAIEAEVRDGGQRDALLYSCGCNAAHGLRRTKADQRRAVLVLLTDLEWSCWSGREIARRCGVSPGLVADVRASLATPPPAERRVQRGGSTYSMSTAGIGRHGDQAAPDRRQTPRPLTDPPTLALHLQVSPATGRLVDRLAEDLKTDQAGAVAEAVRFLALSRGLAG